MFKTAGSTTVVQQIIDKITRSLIKGELKPGDRLPSEPELALQWGVSRTSLREALKTLGGLGVLKAKKRGGTFVATSVSQSMLDPLIFSLIIERGSRDELYEMRVLLEVDGIELVISKASEDDLQQLADELEKYRVAMQEKDEAELAKLDVEFHLKLMELARNHTFYRIATVVMQLFADPIRQTLGQVGAQYVYDNHKALYEAICSRDLIKAKEQVLKSFETSKKFL